MCAGWVLLLPLTVSQSGSTTPGEVVFSTRVTTYLFYYFLNTSVGLKLSITILRTVYCNYLYMKYLADAISICGYFKDVMAMQCNGKLYRYFTNFNEMSILVIRERPMWTAPLLSMNSSSWRFSLLRSYTNNIKIIY